MHKRNSLKFIFFHKTVMTGVRISRPFMVHTVRHSFLEWRVIKNSCHFLLPLRNKTLFSNIGNVQSEYNAAIWFKGYRHIQSSSDMKLGGTMMMTFLVLSLGFWGRVSTQTNKDVEKYLPKKPCDTIHVSASTSPGTST